MYFSFVLSNLAIVPSSPCAASLESCANIVRTETACHRDHFFFKNSCLTYSEKQMLVYLEMQETADAEILNKKQNAEWTQKAGSMCGGKWTANNDGLDPSSDWWRILIWIMTCLFSSIDAAWPVEFHEHFGGSLTSIYPFEKHCRGNWCRNWKIFYSHSVHKRCWGNKMQPTVHNKKKQLQTL